MSTVETATSEFIFIEQEMKQSYMDYAMSVIIGRALPDVRDGLKPVQRRILYAMFDEGHLSNRKHSKCAGVVGEVLKRLHPHGDGPVYDALVRLAQPWNMRYPLIDGQGNFGAIDGDPAAAYRYTECRLASVAEPLLEDIDKETVDFVNNFDDSNVEPTVLPARVPNLLINGASGIAVGMATHMPPHNIGETIDAIIAVIANPSIGIDELMDIMPGPDFPTGGIIYGRSAIFTAFATGRGVITVRARTNIETLNASNREVQAIVVNEIPFQVNKSRLIERIAYLVNNKEIEGISRLRDESDRHGLRIVIELKKDATAEVVLNQLFKSSPLQISFGIINLAIVEGKPQVLTLKQLINCFVDHRRDVVNRRSQFLLGQLRTRLHILEGFRVALLNIDDVINLIKESDSPQSAREGLIGKYVLTIEQASAILDLRLQKLTGLERLAIEKEHQEVLQEIAELEKLISSTVLIDELIVSELKEIRERYIDKRRTDIVEDQGDIFIEDLIEDQDMAVTVSHNCFVKRIPLQVYKAQKRGGRGVTGASAKDDDFIEHIFIASNLTKLLIFTSLGKLHWLSVYKLPESSRTARGRALINLLELREDERVTAFLPVKEYSEGSFVIMATKFGVVKKSSLMDFSRERKHGLIASNLDEGDHLIGAGISNGNDEVILVTRKGMSIRFAEQDIRCMGRTARGVRGVQLDNDDEVVSMSIVSGNVGESGTLLTVCENGFGKRTSLDSYRVQSRGGKGVIDIQTSERNGLVVASYVVSENEQAMMITSSGKVIRFNVADVSVIGRNTQGVRLMNLDDGERLVAVAHLADIDEEEGSLGDEDVSESGVF
jgi:DNA gyrase subunit A